MKFLIVFLCLIMSIEGLIHESKSLQDIRSGLKVLKQQPMTVVTDKANFNYIKGVLLRFLSTLKRNKRNSALNKSPKKTQWDKWTEWSQCSVTCGKGRLIRWRQCKANCDKLETEMEEISCQLPQCPSKIFGIIKL